MAVTLAPTLSARERILVYGPPGTGKTSDLLHVAHRCPTSHFYTIDSDGSFERSLTGKNASLSNVTAEVALDWEGYGSLLAKFQASMKRDDWLIVDMLGPAWDAVQDYFSERVFGKGVDEYFLEARAQMKKGNAFDGRKDWGVINKLYRSFAQQLTLRTPGHVYCTSPAKAVGDEDDKQLRTLYGNVGVRPGGQKEMGHTFHTILLAGRSRQGEWKLTTVKDRERDQLTDHTINDFSTDYLMRVAGWKLTKAAS